jgi:1,4-dihydroxy-2-naphthoate octaprenyltransferase
MGAILGVLTAIGLYIMVGVVFAQFAKGHEYPVWVRLFALVAWPMAALIGFAVMFVNQLKDILKD